MNEPSDTAREQGSSAPFRVAAAALAGLPAGFAAGAVFGGRLLTTPEAPDAGPTLLALGVFGALFAAGAMAFAATLLTPKTTRLATLVVGAASALIVVYMVYGFVTDRMAQARAFDEAYAALPTFELALQADDEDRRPFSELSYRSDTRAYSARRPGGWFCEGAVTRAHNMALFQALPTATSSQLDEGCPLRMSWRIADGAEMRGCASANAEPLVAIADAMIEATERRSSCRRD